MISCRFKNVEEMLLYRVAINSSIQSVSDKYPELYRVHVFYIGALTGDLIERRAMFDSYPEADIWYKSMLYEYGRYDIPHYAVIMNGSQENYDIMEV